MTRKHMTAVLVVLTGLTLVACGKEENKPGGAAGGTSFEELGKKADKAVEEGAAKIAESKEAASKKLEDSAAASGAAKAELDQAVIDLQKRSESAHKDLELLQKAGAEKWQEVSVKVNKKLDEYEKAFDSYWKNLTGK
jgi:hypothetical protein